MTYSERAVSRSRQTIYWTCQIAGWFAMAALYLMATLIVADAHPPSWMLAVASSAGAIAAIAWTHGYRAVLRRRRWFALGLARLAPRVVLAAVVLGTAIPFSAWPVWLLVLGGGASPVSQWAPQAILGWSSAVLAWSVIYLGVHYFERWRQAELDKLQLVIVAQDAQLSSLMAQLQPHFLFNCLNSVRALIVEDPARAQATVTSLSLLLRHTLQAGKASTVPLAAEIEMVRIYLELEAVRFEERLRTDIDIAADAGALQVPAMLVQSLVENGVKHGIERSPAGGTIGVAAWRERGALRVRVTNPGRIGSGDDSTRIGLANARARLQLLYGDGASLALRDGDRTVVAEVSIPIGPAP
jgi:two-component system, LytTR family, sensor histidine kinase AlgZ